MTFIRSSALLKPEFLVTTHTSSQETSNTANVSTVINGSSITYEPYPGSNKVVYEISFYATNHNITQYGECAQYLKLEEYNGSIWSEISSTNRKNFGSESANAIQTSYFYVHLRYVLPAWSGSKQLRLTIAAAENDEKVVLHKINFFDGGNATSMFYSTSLLVYSI